MCVHECMCVCVPTSSLLLEVRILLWLFGIILFIS